jgi:hypothetical protein
MNLLDSKPDADVIVSILRAPEELKCQKKNPGHENAAERPIKKCEQVDRVITA